MMGNELGMPEGDLAGDDTNGICAKVITQYQNNLKVELKAEREAQDRRSSRRLHRRRERVGERWRGLLGRRVGRHRRLGRRWSVRGGREGQRIGQREVHATPSSRSTSTRRSSVDKTKLEMTVKAMRDGLPKLLSVDRAPQADPGGRGGVGQVASPTSRTWVRSSCSRSATRRCASRVRSRQPRTPRRTSRPTCRSRSTSRRLPRAASAAAELTPS